MSIIASGLTKLYGDQKALDGVSFEVHPGEVVGLLGPNGAGKTTLMKIITCFIPPEAGAGSVCGYDISADSLEVRKRIGYLPENNPLYTDLYVQEYLGFIAGIHKLGARKKERVKEMIALTGLGPEQNKKIGALSKGYRQRVGLAQALIHDPEVLILDEPTSGLDPNQIIGIRNLIREIGEKKTVMLSTHIMQEVEAICSRAIIIDKGRIIADDQTKNLAGFADRSVVLVEFDRPVGGDMLKKIPGLTGLQKVNDTTWHLTSAHDRDIRPDVFQFAIDNQVRVLSMQKETLGLEQVFQALTASS
jgi:ABC-2 type transport system ATP-binding protein